MDSEIKAWLFDIAGAINEIESYFIESPKDFEAYKNDTKTRRAVERNIEIIGEAMNRILKKENTIIITSARKIVDLRNIIIHGYDVVSDEIIWGIVFKQLPHLKSEINKLLSE